MARRDVSRDELRRQAALYSLALLDTAPEEGFDRVARLAQRLMGVPAALVSFMDDQRQWHKARVGVLSTEAVRSESFCTHVVGEGKPLVVEDATIDARFSTNPCVVGEDGVRFYAGVPIHNPAGYAIGTLCVFDDVPRRVDETSLEPLFDLAAMVDEIIAGRVQATIDELTGVQNRRGFLLAATPLLRLADRAELVVTLGFFDINGLKLINDEIGHDAGDVAIAEVGDLLATCFRAADVVARLGGDEFVVLFVTCEEGATTATERLDAAIDERNRSGGLPFTISVAAGFIERQPAGDGVDSLLARADQLMYERKRASKAKAAAPA